MPLRHPCALFLMAALAGTSFAEDSTKEITVLSYNIRLGGRRMDGVYDRPLQFSVATAQKADFVALQEVDRKTSRVKGADVPTEFAQALSMNYHYAPAITVGGGEYGPTALTKFPITHTATIPLPTPIENRSAALLVAKLTNGAEVMFVSTHLDSFEEQNESTRLANTRDLLAAIAKEKTTAPVIIAGDLNTSPDSPIFKLFTDAGFRRCESKAGADLSYPADKPNQLLDYVLIRDGATISIVDAGTEVVNEPRSSDHRPLISRLRLVPKTS